MKKLLFIATVLVIAFSSCKKDDPVPTCNLDANGVSGNYKITSILYKADAATPEIDLFTFFEACEKDNILTLNSNGTYAISEGATTCTPSTADNGTWGINGTTMTIDGEPGTVSNFSCSGMTITQTITATGEVTKIVLVKQ